MVQKKPQGRKKRGIKKIDELSSRQVAFSKLWAEISNEASELCVLTGVEAAILVQSPGGGVSAFGNPSVESVMGHYFGGISSGAPDQQQPEEYNQQYSEISKELEGDQKNKSVAVEETKEKNYWWNRRIFPGGEEIGELMVRIEEESIEELGVEELEKYIAAMEKLRDNLKNI